MARPIPYQPMHPPSAPVSYSRMQEILQKNVAAKVEVKLEPAGEEHGGALEWEKPEPKSRLLYTKDRRFRVRKWSGSEALKESPEWKYQAEVLVENIWYYAFGRIRDSFAESEADCKTFLAQERK